MSGWTVATRQGILTTMRRLVLLLVLASCAAPPPTADGRWFGTASPAPAKPGCNASRASLVLRRAVVLFTPDEGTWTLEGNAAPDGSLTAERSGIGVSKQPFKTTFKGSVTPAGITGTYITPRCAFAVALQPP